jgi:nucleoside phosphorylase
MQLAEMHPRQVLLVGTCGAYPGAGLSVGEAVAARRVRLVSPAVVDGTAQFPEPMSIASDAHPPATDALARAGARVGDVATTLAITIDDATAARVAQATGAHVEHLEAHGVACACAARGIPFGAVLGVANSVGSRARDEWRMHHRAAASAATEVVLRWLHEAPSPTAR